ncbi:60S ribosomal subunit assembly/export protein, partial [Elasticomyces elasticus]
MAVVKAKGSKPPARKGLARKSATAGPSKSKSKPQGKLPPSLSKQVKTKPGAQAGRPKKKRPVYTEKQLGLPALNTIVPANAKIVQKAGGTGKKKDKVYVDDQEQMMTILALVNAEKEGQIESKIQKQRQLEEIRQARVKEQEKRDEKKSSKLEKVKGEIKDEKRIGKRERGNENAARGKGDRLGKEEGARKSKRKS